jgi:hypothetical protein
MRMIQIRQENIGGVPQTPNATRAYRIGSVAVLSIVVAQAPRSVPLKAWQLVHIKGQNERVGNRHI